MAAIFNLLVGGDASIGPLQPLCKAYRALVSVQKPTDKSRLFLYDIDEVCDFPVLELAIPIKMV